MEENKYLKKLTKEIHNSEMRKEILKEYEAHIEDCKEALMESGMSEKEAEEEAIRQMGDPLEAGREMNSLYRNVIDWSMLLWFLCWGSAMCTLGWAVGRYGVERGTFFVYKDLPIITNAIGGFLIVFGLTWSAVEKWMDYPLLYAWGNYWNGGGFANSGVLIALGLLFVGTDNWRTALWLLSFLAIIQTVERSIIQIYRHKYETKLLWEIGTAETEILPYKGTATICGKRRKVETKEGEVIQQGAPVMVVALDGMKPVVVQV